MRASKAYRHILFDLDHTLWDYESNSSEALKSIFVEHKLDRLPSLTVDAFVGRFFAVNEQLWEKYDRQAITSEELRGSRFHLILNEYGLTDDQDIQAISASYLQLSPRFPAVMPHAFEILDYLKPKYGLHIITNGFYDIQFTKLDISGLSPYFAQVVTSEETGARKPNPHIFEHAMERIGTGPEECIMIGDNLRTDIAGASNASIDHVFYNPEGKPHQHQPTHEIRSLLELKAIL